MQLFSESICGPDNQIHLSNDDYRLMLGVLRATFDTKDDIDLERAWAAGKDILQQRTHPSARNIVDRMCSLVHDVDVSCPLRKRLEDVYRLIEVSYPLGTIVTDVEGGEDTFLSAAGAIRVNPGSKTGVRSGIEFVPEGRNTIAHYVIDDMEHSYVGQDSIEDGNTSIYGKERRVQQFFRQRFGRTFHVQPTVDIGDDHSLPGWLVAMRCRGRLALMLKHVGTKAYSTEASATMSENGDIKTTTRTRQEVQDGVILSVRQWGTPERSENHFARHPEAVFEFSTGVRAVNEPFGKAVRMPASSAE